MQLNECGDYFECPADIVMELENWRRWATGRTNSSRNRCKSLESRYKSTDVWEGKQVTIEINILEAVEVEKIISGLPVKNKAAIKAYYIQRLPTHIMRRRLGERDIGCLMRNTWCMIKNKLDKTKKPFIMGITVEPSHDEINRLEAA